MNFNNNFFSSNKIRKISEITDEAIIFSDHSSITFDHDQDCCENNYAAFDALDDLARNYTFRGEIRFEAVDESGFRFGDARRMFFVPCYSSQNGYYSSDIQIYFNENGKTYKVLDFEAELNLY